MDKEKKLTYVCDSRLYKQVEVQRTNLDRGDKGGGGEGYLCSRKRGELLVFFLKLNKFLSRGLKKKFDRNL